MSRPPIDPEKSVAGIALDPITLERVIPESKRPDGTVRKQLKIRPGFTPQEDIRRFRGTKQAQMDSNALPKGHVIGWAPPPSSSKADGETSGSGTTPMSKAAKKNAKRKEKRGKEKVEKEVPDNWEDEEVPEAKNRDEEKEEEEDTELSSKLENLKVS
jgi:partner of Y14 and mago protein